MTTPTKFDEFDEFLAGNNCESKQWNEEGLFQQGENYLENFTPSDWLALRDIWRDKNQSWKACLVCILNPYFGNDAQEMIIDMAKNKNPKIAFEAMYAISFYCGINENDEGLFFDKDIIHWDFRNKIITDLKFVAMIPKIAQRVGQSYDLLQESLNNPQHQ